MIDRRGSRAETRRISFALAAAGAGLLTLSAMVGGIVLVMLITSVVLAGSSTGAAAGRDGAKARAPAFATASSSGFAFGWSGDRAARFWYALVSPDGGSLTGSTDSDSWSDIRREIGSGDGEALWVRIEDADYVVRDRAMLSRAHAIVRPMRELGERQGRLGQLQAALGRRQAGLGAEQARLGARQAELALTLTHLSMRRDDEDREAERREIEREMNALSRQQEDLGRRQEPLSRGQNELGRRQNVLGREQQRVSARAAEEMRGLTELAIERGLAVRVK